MPNKSYDDLATGISQMNIRTDNSPITIYVQHPIPIPAPGDKNKVAMKPLKLTKKEQKKMRKQQTWRRTIPEATILVACFRLSWYAGMAQPALFTG